MPSINDTKHDEATDASWEATRGAISGAVKWGLGTAILGGLGYAMSPVYRGLTIQFKVYVQRFLCFLCLLSLAPILVSFPFPSPTLPPAVFHPSHTHCFSPPSVAGRYERVRG